MKKVFIAAILSMCCVTALMLGTGSAFTTIEDEGYAVPASAGIMRSLAEGGSAPISLVEVQYDDVIYSSITGYYIGETREQIDFTYPLYMKGGTGLRFLDDENWLITADVDLFQTFDGLYLSDGISYNEDMTQADGGEFILLALPNSGYMNAQQAVFENRIGERIIPTNSILSLSEDSISWYEQKNGTLAYQCEESVFDASLTIGSHTYHYTDLLDALGLIREVIQDSDNKKPDPDVLQKADDILNGKKDDNSKKPWNNAGTAADVSGVDGEGTKPDETGDQGTGDIGEDPIGDGTDGPVNGGDDVVPGGSHENSAGEKDTPPENSGATTGAEDGDAGKDDPLGEAPSGGSGDPDSGDTGTSGSMSGGDSATGGGSGASSGGSAGGDASSGGASDSAGSGTGGTEGSGGSSGDSSGQGSSSGSGAGTGGNTGEEPGDQPSGDEPGESGDPGESNPPPYQEPKVTLESVSPWCYALGVDLKIDDPSGAIVRGVSISVYKSIKKTGDGEPTTNEAGYKTYPSDGWEGKSTALRRTRSDSKPFALSTLEPGKTVYLQYSYRYGVLGKDPETGVETYERRRFYSNLIEITLPEVNESNVKTVSADWTAAFAAHADALELDDLTLANTSNYNADAEEYSFENFKLNTLPYVNRLKLTLTPDQGEEVEVVVGSAVLARAQQQKGVDFTSSTPKLASNTHYTYTVEALDRYGNTLPFRADGLEHGNSIYTRKATPEVTITEAENITDYVALKIKVSDPDEALTPGRPLRLAVLNNGNGTAAELSGEWKTEEISAVAGGVELKNPHDGSEYEMKIDSLAFSCLYSVEVRGDYKPQPNVSAPKELPAEENELFGQLTIYTASITSGQISFQSGVTNLMDTSATLNATMTSNTTVDILKLVNEFRIILSDKQGTVISETKLSKSDLIQGDRYKVENAVVELQEGDAKTPRVVLYGAETQYRGNPWDSFLIGLTDPDPDQGIQGGYTSPMQLQVILPRNEDPQNPEDRGLLKPHTDYTFAIQAIVQKSGQDYRIPVSMTNSSFTTKKTIPDVTYDDLFLAADKAQFLGLKVVDPDGTILNDGQVTVSLKLGNTTLAVQTIKTSDPPQDLLFTGLIEGSHYTLEFVASAYNDADGYGSYRRDYLLESIPLTGGSALFGSLGLTKLQQTAGADTFEAEIRVKATDTMGYLVRPGESGQVTMTLERSDSMELPNYKPYGSPFDFKLEKKQDQDGNTVYSVDVTKELTGLKADSGWRATLSFTYGSNDPMQLASIEFRSDKPYVTVSNHKELNDAIQKNKYANIVVTDDFEQENLGAPEFYGTIDFQGHVVKRGTGVARNFLNIQRDAKVTNLVYDYPDVPRYETSSNIFGYLYGTVENLIVRTHGEVEISYVGAQSPLIGSGSQSSQLRNFIVQLGGDLVMRTPGGHGVGAIMGGSHGIIENGYIYGKNGAGFVSRGNAGAHSLFGVSHYGGQTRNIYILLDSWYEPGMQSTSALITTSGNYETAWSHIYAVGDYYQVGTGEGRNYLLPLTNTKLVRYDYPSLYNEVWTINSGRYTTEAEFQSIGHGNVGRLYDQQWQSDMLGSAFDVEGCIPRGFYPRLNLPVYMQKNQEYLPLPAQGTATVPQLISDGWADNNHGLDRGDIRLRFRNDSNLEIREVKIDGLVAQVVSQGKSEKDGLYDVIVHVEVDPSSPQYVSSYKVTGFSYISATGAREVAANYTTTGIEFWKEVATVRDWSDINYHMNWNYKVTEDLDFSGSILTPSETIVDGSVNGFPSPANFTGRLDGLYGGREHVLRGIRLENLTRPYLIGSVSQGEVKNLFVEDAVISASSRMAGDNCGLIGSVSRSTVENVRMRNCQVSGGGRLGLLAGYSGSGTFQNCSAVECSLTDTGVDKSLYAGGLVGYNAGYLISCYTREVRIEITNTIVVLSVGGLTGFNGSVSLDSCYAHGSMKVAGSNVGGISGDRTHGDASVIQRCWSYVDLLQTSGNNAGGIQAQVYVAYNCAALGNVAGAGSAANRISGTTGGTRNACYAYDGQIVTGLAEGAVGDANGLLTGAQLSRAATWQDKIRLGSRWDYTPVDRGCTPKLAEDCALEDWRQQDIYLPGQSTDPVLKVDQAKYDSASPYHYQLIARLDHPGISYETIKGIYDEKKLTIEMKGMELTDSALASKDASIEVGNGGENSTIITILTKEFKEALDTYPLTVKYTDPESSRERELTVMVIYLENGQPHQNAHVVRNLGEWNTVVREHGTTGENILIDGTVDFGGQDTEYKDLTFNRLEGTTGSGFANLQYSGGEAGLPWISKVGTRLGDLSFTNMAFNFTATLQSLNRTMTGAILNVGGGGNLTLDNIVIRVNQYSRSSCGFIANAGGTIDGVTMSNVQLTDIVGLGDTKASSGNCCGALVGETTAGINNVKAENITVNVPKSNYVGGILGRLNIYGPSFLNNTIKDFEIVGQSTVGGLAGLSYANGSVGSTAEKGDGPAGKGTVIGTGTVGGLFGSRSRTGGEDTDWKAKDLTVTATSGRAGGITGNGHHINSVRAEVTGCTITATTHAGGMNGGNSGNAGHTVTDAQITGCTIKSTGTDGIAGGLIGNVDSIDSLTLNGIVIRDCTIEGENRVGGLIGSSNRTKTGAKISRVYVAEDVTVTARNSMAGGLIGWLDKVDSLTSSACGATVTANGSEAGGLIGHLEPQEGKIVAPLSNLYYRGTVTAKVDYAGGVVGKLNSGSPLATDDNMKNILVAADVRSPGGNTSLWINSSTTTGSPGTGLIYICEDSMLNGQTARAIMDSAQENGEKVQLAPEHLSGTQVELIVPSAQFGTQKFYQDRGFAATAWDYADLTKFMPYTRASANNSNPLEKAKKYDYGKGEVDVGIELPEAGSIGVGTVVYASGVDTINIETGLAQKSNVTVDGTQIETDDNGVVTLYYDFQTSFTVDGVTYTADELRRKVMTYGTSWYHIDGRGEIVYGSAVKVNVTDSSEKAMEKKGTVAGVSGAVHLWQSKALAGSTVYDLNGGIASSSGSADTNLKKAPASVPFWVDPGSGAKNYYYFSMYNGSRIPERRAFSLDGRRYPVTYKQGTLYDSVVLSKTSSSLYFAMLHGDKLEAYVNSMYIRGDLNSGIQYISNNLGYSGTALMIYYKDGSVVGVDYSTGTENMFYSTRPATVSFFTYARQALSNLLRPGEAGVLTSDGSFQEGEALQEELAGAGGPEQPGDTPTVDGTSINDAGGGDPVEGSIPENGGGSGDGQDGLGLGDGSQIIDGSSDADGGSEALDGSGVGDGVGENGLIPGLDGADAEGELVNGEMAASAGSELPAEDGKSQIGSVSGEAGPEGTAEDGQAGREEPIGQSSDGGAAENGSDSVEQPGSNPSVLASGLKNPGSESGAPESGVSEQKTEEALRELFGDSVIAYSEKTGRYELLETASLSTGEPVKMVDALARKSESGAPQKPDGVQDPETPAGEDHFAVAWGINRSLYAEEKQGFLLIALAAGVGVIVLTMLYFKVIRKRKR